MLLLDHRLTAVLLHGPTPLNLAPRGTRGSRDSRKLTLNLTLIILTWYGSHTANDAQVQRLLINKGLQHSNSNSSNHS